MAQRIINNGDSGFTIRKNLNDNFTEIYNRLQQLEGEVPDENLPPTDITLSASSINEGNEIGDVIGTLLAIDPDVGDTHTFELVAGTGDTDNLSFTIEGDQLKANEIFSYNVKTAYSIRIRATDQGGLFFEKQFEITIIEVPVSEFHPEILAYEDGLTTPLDEGQKIRLNNLTDELKTGLGLTSLDEAFDYFYVFGNDTEEVSIRNLVKRAHDCTPYNVNNKLVWEHYKGYRDTANDGYLRTNYNPAIDGINFTKDSGSFGLRTFTMNSNGGVEMGCSDGTNRISINLRNSGTPIYFNNNTSDGTSAGSSTVTPVAHIVSRNSANEFKYYREGVLTHTSTEPSVGVPNAEIQIIGYNDNGTPASFVQRQQFINFMGRAFTDAEALVITNAINNYIGSLTMFIPTPPEDIFLSSTSFIEGNAVGDIVAEITSTDVNEYDNTFTYQLVSGTGDTDNSAFLIDGYNLLANTVFDSTTKSAYSIRLRSTDSEGLFTDKVFNISIVGSEITLQNLVNNGDFSLDSNSDGIPDNVVITNKATYTMDADSVVGVNSLKVELNPTTGDSTGHTVDLDTYNRVEGHKHYIGFWCKSGYTRTYDATDSILRYVNVAGYRLPTPSFIEDGWQLVSGILPMSGTSENVNLSLEFRITNYKNRSAGEYFLIDGVFNIDLTAAFGAGNEPTVNVMDLIIRNSEYFSGQKAINYTASTIDALKNTDAVVQSRQTRTDNGILRIATHNQKSGHLYGYAAMQFINKADLDIIALQECYEYLTLPDKFSVYERFVKNNFNLNHIHKGATISTQIDTVRNDRTISAFPFVSTEVINTNVTNGPGVLKSVFSYMGQLVSVYNVHLKNDDTDIPLMVSRVQAVYDIVSQDTNNHIIVLGDFNNPTGDNPTDRLDMTQQSMFVNGGFTPTQGWNNIKFNTYIEPLGWTLILDHIWVKGFNILNANTIFGDAVSDHNLLWAEIEMILP